MRITQNSMQRTQLAGLNASLNRLQQTQEQLTTGKRLNRPSDSPIDTVTAMRLRGQQAQLDQFGENIADGLDRLSTADNALTSSSPVLNRIRTIVVAASNQTNGPSQRTAYAQEIRALKGALLQVANTQHAGRPVFGGTAYDPTGANNNAFDPTSGTWLGNDSPVLRKVTDAPGTAGQMDIAVNGQDAFGADMFTAGGFLDSLANAVESGVNTSMPTALTDLDSRMGNVLKAQATIGAKVKSLANLKDVNGRQSDSSLVALSTVEDTDFTKAAMDLGIRSSAYQAALSASAKIIQPSLVDFLR